MRFLTVRSLCQGPFVRNVAVLASGTLIAQFITLAFAPFITRLYGPEVLGTVGVFNSLVMIAGPIAALNYPIAIVLSDRDEKAVALVNLSLIIALFLSITVALMLVLFGDAIIVLLRVEVIKSFIMLLPVAMFSAAALDIAQQWVFRKKFFGLSGRIAAIHSLVINCAKAGGGFLQPTASVLISIAAITSGLRAAMLRYALQQSNNILIQETKLFSQQVSPNFVVALSKTALRYREYPLFRTPQTFINAVSQNLPVIALAHFEGAAAAGLYVLATQLLALPSMLIGQSVSSVFYPRFSDAVRSGQNLARLLWSATLGLAAVGTVPFGLIMLFGPWLFSFAFGAEWRTSGEYAQWLALWLYFGFMNRPSMSAIPVLGQERFLLIWEAIATFSRIAALVVGFKVLSKGTYAIILFAIIGAIANIVLIGWVSLMASKRSAFKTFSLHEKS